ncbi:MAG: EAL domain-containing protein [Gaiellales bacterium]
MVGTPADASLPSAETGDVARHERAEGSPQQQAEQLRRVIDVQHELAAADVDQRSVMVLACERLQELTGAEGAAVMMVEGAEIAVRASTGFFAENTRGLRLPHDGTLSGWVVKNGVTAICRDTSTDPRSGVLARAHGVCSHAIVPLRASTGEIVGLVQIASPRRDAFDRATVDLVELVSVALHAAFSRAAEAGARQAELAALDRFRTIFETAPIGIVQLSASGRPLNANPALERMLGYTATELSDVGLTEYGGPDDTTEHGYEPAGARRTERLLARKDGTLVWAQVTSTVVTPADGSQQYSLAMIEDISARREVEEALRAEAERNEFQALHDPLTGLPNRVLFRDRIQQTLRAAPRADTAATVLIMDVDRFKEINDSLGHHAGDLLLLELGTRLEQEIRGGDTVARLGGDEFGILLADGGSADDVSLVLRRIVEVVEKPFVLEDIEVSVELSIGVARYPEHGGDVVSLMRHADVAMYSAKRAGVPYAFYDPSSDAHDPARLSLLGDLRRAIEERELVLHYQPKAVLATGDIRSVEALIRWQHPTRGLVRPDEFIPLAQETSLITPLTLYVIEEALAEVGRWREAYGRELSVAVNLSVRNLLDLTFPDQVEQLLERAGTEPGVLELEITESTMLADPLRVQQVLSRLAALGLRISIDDFGAGYSSLTYLRRLPVNEIKIDRSFVTNMVTDESDAAIVRSVIELAKSLRLDVVAEGVEDEATWRRLDELGCAFAQGYHLSRPLPATDFLAWLRARDGGRAAVDR